MLPRPLPPAFVADIGGKWPVRRLAEDAPGAARSGVLAAAGSLTYPEYARSPSSLRPWPAWPGAPSVKGNERLDSESASAPTSETDGEELAGRRPVGPSPRERNRAGSTVDAWIAPSVGRPKRRLTRPAREDSRRRVVGRGLETSVDLSSIATRTSSEVRFDPDCARLWRPRPPTLAASESNPSLGRESEGEGEKR